MRPLEPCFCNAVWHLRSLSARSSLGDLRSSLQVVPPRRRFWRLLARVVLVCFGIVPSLPWAISRAGSGRTGSSRRALHGPQNLLGIGDWLLLPTACHTQAGTPPECTSRSGCALLATGTRGPDGRARDPVWVRRGRASKRVRAHMRSIALALVQRAVEDKRVRCLAQILGWSAQPASGLSPWRSPSAFS